MESGLLGLTSNGRGGQNQPIAARQWAAGFLPGQFQGVQLRSKGDPVLYLPTPPGVDQDQQKDVSWNNREGEKTSYDDCTLAKPEPSATSTVPL